MASGSSLIPTVVSRLDDVSSRASSPNLPSNDSPDPSGSRPSSRNTVLPTLNAAASQSLSALGSGAAGGCLDTGGPGASSSSGLALGSSSLVDKASTSTGHSTKHFSGGNAASSSSSSSQLNYNAFSGMSNPAIAAAASQAIAATTHMQQGRRTSSLKASYEALRNAGELAKELTFGGAAGGAEGSGSGGAYGGGSNSFVTEGPGASSSSSTSTKANRHKKVRPNNSSASSSQQQSAAAAVAAAAAAAHLGQSGSSILDVSNLALANIHFGSPLNPNGGGGGVSSSSSSSQLTGQSGSQDSYSSSGIDDYFGGGGGGGAVGGLTVVEGGGGAEGGAPLGGEGEFQAVDGGDWAYDPNEPRYCICNQVSYGEMVGCDNGDCPIEWFHYGCVGLTQAPKGKWFCPQCTAAMKRRNRR